VGNLRTNPHLRIELTRRPQPPIRDPPKVPPDDGSQGTPTSTSKLGPGPHEPTKTVSSKQESTVAKTEGTEPKPPQKPDEELTRLSAKVLAGKTLSQTTRKPIADATITVGQDSAHSGPDGAWELRFLRQPERDGIVRAEHRDHLSQFLRFEDLLANNEITLAPKYRLIVLERGDRSDVLVRSIRKAIAVRLAGCQAVTLLAEQDRDQLVGLLEKYQKGRGLYDKGTVAEAGRFLGATHVVLVSIATDVGPKKTAECSMIELETIETKAATTGVLESEEQTELLGQRLADEVLVALSKVKILTPVDNTEVPVQTSVIKVSGYAVSLPQSWGLQLSILTPGNPRHFFQRGMTVKTEGEWLCTDAYIGRDTTNTSEAEFVIYAVLLDPKANAVVQDYLKQIEADPDSNKGVDLKSLNVREYRLLNSIRVKRPGP
jgi:hypothetical protein